MASPAEFGRWDRTALQLILTAYSEMATAKKERLENRGQVRRPAVEAIRAVSKNSCIRLTYIGACRGDFHVDTGGTCALAYTSGMSFEDPEAAFYSASLLNGRATFLGSYGRVTSSVNVVEFIEFSSSDGRRCGT